MDLLGSKDLDGTLDGELDLSVGLIVRVGLLDGDGVG
jgi:hypothetical protein